MHEGKRRSCSDSFLKAPFLFLILAVLSFSGCNREEKKPVAPKNLNLALEVMKGKVSLFEENKLKVEIRGDKISSSADFKKVEFEGVALAALRPEMKILYLYADDAVYDQKRKIIVLTGNVRTMMEPDFSLHAGKITFEMEPEILTIENGFRGRYQKRYASGPRLVYEMKSKRIIAGKSP